MFLLELSATENVPILKMNFGDRHMPVYSAANGGYWILADTAWAAYNAANRGYWILADTAWAAYNAANRGY